MGMSDDGIRDWELLNRYAQKGAQDAFAQIVKRYVDLVYATCFRDLRDHHLAEDATQAVFLVLSRKAASLRCEVVLAGWLFQTARLVVRNVRKQEARRKARERSAAEMLQQSSPSGLAWGGLTPLLNEGLGRLGSKDRDAILLHYFQHKTMAEVGDSTGVSEDAARMRVSRAVQKLRSFFSRKGQTLAVGAVATLLMANAVQAAPPSCAASAVAAVCGTAAHAALASSSAATLASATMKSLVAAKVKMAATIAAMTLLVPAAGMATYHAISTRREADRQVAQEVNSPDDSSTKNVLSEGVALGSAPATAAPAGRPAPARPSASSPNASSPNASSPKSNLSKSQPPPRTQTPRVDPPLTDRIRFRVERGLLTVAGPAVPADGKAVPVALRGVAGDTTIARKPSSLSIENHQAADGREVRTRVVYEPGASMALERTIQPRNGKAYALMFRQSHMSNAAMKSGQTTVRVTTDGGESWTSWAADDFPRFAENYPLAYFAHLAPMFRDFSARYLCAVPAAVARKALGEAKAAAEPTALTDLLSQGDTSRAAVLWRREINMLNRDVPFLVDCLESDDLDVRAAALKQLSDVLGKAVAFDVNGPADKRRAALNLLRQRMGANSGL
jgi:RNA polymerase sigma factor (sigma-70 family)